MLWRNQKRWANGDSCLLSKWKNNSNFYPELSKKKGFANWEQQIKGRNSYGKTGVDNWKAGVNNIKGQLEGKDKNLVQIKTEKGWLEWDVSTKKAILNSQDELKWVNSDVKLDEVKNDIIEKVKMEIFEDVNKLSNDIRDEFNPSIEMDTDEINKRLYYIGGSVSSLKIYVYLPNLRFASKFQEWKYFILPSIINREKERWNLIFAQLQQLGWSKS